MTRTPQDTFLSDQGMAAARDLAADGTTIAIFQDLPDGEQCSWCDCPDEPESPHAQPGYRCPACPAAAASVLRIYDGTSVRRDIPVCARHQAEAIAFVALVIKPRNPGMPQEPRP